MDTSKLKLALHWLLFVVGFYLFWGLSYLILTKFALSQVSSFQSNTGNIWSQLTATDIFWYVMFIFGIAVVIYVIRLFINYAPNVKIAVLIYAVLIIASVAILVNKLAESTTVINLMPHIIINLAFLVPMAMMFFKGDENKNTTDTEEEDPDL
jgi:phosphoglycerol transferase MdoB-like AlkP superfamily enzyme